MILGIAAIIRDCPKKHTISKTKMKRSSLGSVKESVKKTKYTPFLPMYSAIWPLAIAPTIAPTLDREPNTEYYTWRQKLSKSQTRDQKAALDIGSVLSPQIQSNPDPWWLQLELEKSNHTEPKKKMYKVSNFLKQMNRERWELSTTYSESELNRTKSNDQNTSKNGDWAVFDDLRRTHHARLSWTHPVPASCVHERSSQLIPGLLCFIPRTHLFDFLYLYTLKSIVFSYRKLQDWGSKIPTLNRKSQQKLLWTFWEWR